MNILLILIGCFIGTFGLGMLGIGIIGLIYLIFDTIRKFRWR